MSQRDGAREPIRDQAVRMVGRRVAVCVCQKCGEPFLASKVSATWCSAACRKAAQRSKQDA